MDILIVGGTPLHRGGVELFCERAQDALAGIGGHRVEWVRANTAYLRLRSLGRVGQCVGRLVRRRGQHWDCLWLQYVNLPDLALLLVCRLLGYRVLVTPHLGSNWSSQSNRWLRGLSLRLLGLAHGIAPISATQAEELALPPGPPRLQIRTFLPRAFPDPGLVRQQGPELALVHAGRLSEGKGTFLFLQVCATLRRRGCRFSARLIGSCDDATRRRIDAAIQDNDLASSVAVTGLLPETELLAALSQADVLVHLSTIDSFPLIVLEAVGCGVFPICKDLPGARSMIGTYCGHLVAGPDAVAEVAAFLGGATPDQLRSTAALTRGRLAADYAWERCVAALEDAVRAVSDGGRVHPAGAAHDVPR